jgi:hypothetical protein
MSDHLYTIQGHACPACWADVAMAGDDWVGCRADCGYRRLAGDEDGREEERQAFAERGTTEREGCQ